MCKFLYLKGKVVGKTVYFIRIIHVPGKKQMSFWAYMLFWGRCAHILLNNKFLPTEVVFIIHG